MTPVITGDDICRRGVITHDDPRQRLKDQFIIIDLPAAGSLADATTAQQAAALETIESARNIAAIEPGNGRYPFHAWKGSALFVRV